MKNAVSRVAARALPAVARAQDAEQVHVRGSIVAVDGKVVKVRPREGRTVDVTLADGARVAGVASAAIGDIKPGDFVGIASLPRADGGDGGYWEDRGYEWYAGI